jgi:hypothetical protein
MAWQGGFPPGLPIGSGPGVPRGGRQHHGQCICRVEESAVDDAAW